MVIEWVPVEKIVNFRCFGISVCKENGPVFSLYFGHFATEILTISSSADRIKFAHLALSSIWSIFTDTVCIVSQSPLKSTFDKEVTGLCLKTI